MDATLHLFIPVFFCFCFCLGEVHPATRTRHLIAQWRRRWENYRSTSETCLWITLKNKPNIVEVEEWRGGTSSLLSTLLLFSSCDWNMWSHDSRVPCVQVQFFSFRSSSLQLRRITREQLRPLLVSDVHLCRKQTNKQTKVVIPPTSCGTVWRRLFFQVRRWCERWDGRRSTIRWRRWDMNSNMVAARLWWMR